MNQPTYNSGLAKVAVQCSADTFVVNQTLVLRINICGENRHLRQAANRYRRARSKILFTGLKEKLNQTCLSGLLTRHENA